MEVAFGSARNKKQVLDNLKIILIDRTEHEFPPKVKSLKLIKIKSSSSKLSHALDENLFMVAESLLEESEKV